MSKLPNDVLRYGKLLAEHPNRENAEIAKKLIHDTPELVAMWQTLERRRNLNDPWNIWIDIFLSTAREASRLPPFHYKSAKDKRELAKRIETRAKTLSRALRVNGLDEHLIFGTGKMFPGFMFYEDFGWSNRARFDASGEPKLEISRLLDEVAKRIPKRIAAEPIRGKAGKNARAVRFARIVSEHNKVMFGSPLNAVVAAAANAIYGARYTAVDIRKLMAR
ncbi:MAG: hypothetical protein O2960_28660 [Verrucomicrobia bacterium]|nr:hypothetical protein [Verrucomicrobiota bacterium]